MPLRPALCAMALMAVLPSPSSAATPTATGTGIATAEVVSPMAVTSTDMLEFGTVVGPGTVTVAPTTSAVSYGGGAEGVCRDACPLPHAARFAVAGEAGRAYSVTAPTAIHVTAQGGGGGTVVVDSFTVSTRSRPGESWGQLDALGQDHFEVGGVLHLDGTSAPGQYKAQVPVTVQYF